MLRDGYPEDLGVTHHLSLSARGSKWSLKASGALEETEKEEGKGEQGGRSYFKPFPRKANDCKGIPSPFVIFPNKPFIL